MIVLISVLDVEGNVITIGVLKSSVVLPVTCIDAQLASVGGGRQAITAEKDYLFSHRFERWNLHSGIPGVRVFVNQSIQGPVERFIRSAALLVIDGHDDCLAGVTVQKVVASLQDIFEGENKRYISVVNPQLIVASNVQPDIQEANAALQLRSNVQILRQRYVLNYVQGNSSDPEPEQKSAQGAQKTA